MKILPCDRRERFAAFSRLRSSQLNNIELPIHMIPAIRCAHRKITSSNSCTATARLYSAHAVVCRHAVRSVRVLEARATAAGAREAQRATAAAQEDRARRFRQLHAQSLGRIL